MVSQEDAHILLGSHRSIWSNEYFSDITVHIQWLVNLDITTFSKSPPRSVKHIPDAENDVARLLLMSISISLGSEAVPYEQICNE